MGDSIKQAIFEELNTVLKNPAQQNEERLNQLKYTECKFLLSKFLHTFKVE